MSRSLHLCRTRSKRLCLVARAAVLVLACAAIFACNQTDVDRSRTIAVWAMAGKADHWRADNVVTAAERLAQSLPEFASLAVQPVNLPGGAADYKKKFTLAAEAGRGPDIAVSGHEDIAAWASAGYIVPLAPSVTQLLERFPELERVHPSLWPACTWQGQVWAVPQDVEARPLYFSKTRLHELGWSDDEIAVLPDRIARGAYTLDDMIATAREAVARGVVRPGFGFWHRSVIGADHLQFYVAYGGRLYDEASDRLVITRSALVAWLRFQREAVTSEVTSATLLGTERRIWQDTVAHHNVLFWQAGSWAWVDWAENYVQGEGGGDFLEQTTGYALVPSGIRGQPAATLSHPLVYMVTQPAISGQQHQDQSRQILAAVTAPDLDARHVVDSAHLSILRQPQLEQPADENGGDRHAARRRFLDRIGYMLDHNYYLPNHAGYAQYFDVLWENMVAATTGNKSPELAADEAIAELEIELGDALLIE